MSEDIVRAVLAAPVNTTAENKQKQHVMAAL
jgi:hypothetical protein